MALGWKVVSVTKSGKLQSAFGCQCADVYLRQRQDYTIGQWTVRKKGWGPLAVFDTETHSRTFVRNELNTIKLEVFPCEYIPSDDRDLWGLLDVLTNNVKIWNWDSTRLGTVYADAVRIF